MTVHKSQHIRQSSARLGWSREEDTMLFEAAQKARGEGIPLKSVFDEIAKDTGRKPNSIRNYYYARVKQGDEFSAGLPHNPAFVPFEDNEIVSLLRTVIGAQARGMSVRACTLEMGGGDNRAMLRYQNKYRSMLKSNPELVKRVVEDMRAEGQPVVDPFERTVTQKRVGRPRKRGESLLDVVGGVINQLDKIEGIDVSLFFESLGALALSAVKGSQAQSQLQTMGEYKDTLSLFEENKELKERMLNQQKELIAQRERFNMLLGYFRQIVDVNREFLGMTSVTKVSSLSNYIRELSRNVEDCEKWMLESK